ncbi:hypothetical protein T552_02197 [Pneumocystis carinii B80]|uniref:RNA polymerase II subunit A C-terminal domain phosphatase n=1 Tax=Pneumocystis carinii (strain B80) TaxID=1408658 RepID=A0A0W4ZHB8_PNEC8|nr:hypothetical protein T552_02197 [Pneumocystis carinii B80]KTW27757.1 hypothetical protein T552_02197 [Pneumocystis carinii B80]
MNQEPTYVYLPPSLRFPVTVVSISVKVFQPVKKHDLLLSYRYQGTFTEYDEDGSERNVAREYVDVFQSPIEGVVDSWFVREGVVIKDQYIRILSIIEPCLHSVQYHGLCATCGRDVTQQDFMGFSDSTRATIQMSHDATKLTVSRQEAARLERETAERLLNETKLSLIVDLDQTILHATVDPIVGEWLSDPSSEHYAAVRDVQTFCLREGNASIGSWYYIKMRPGLEQFLENISKLYEMHIYTMGTRAYAASIAQLIDKDKKYFGDRILSRDESGNTTQKNIQRLFPVDTSMVVIIDDRADVWQWSPNLIKVTPYEFFVGIGDINGDFVTNKPSLHNFSSSLMPASLSALQTSPTNQQTMFSYSPETPFIPTHDNVYNDMLANDLNTVLQDDFRQAMFEHKINSLVSGNQDVLVVVNDQTKTGQSFNGINHLEFFKKPTEKIFFHNNDTELQRLESSLRLVHREFYKEYNKLLKTRKKHDLIASFFENINLQKNYDPDISKLDIKIIMPALKENVLKGTVLLFSGVIPMGVDVLSSNIAQWAINFGAQIAINISNNVTHLIATKIRTTKVKKAQQKNIKIVSIDWLLHSISHWKRLPESDYLLHSFSENDIFNNMQFQGDFHPLLDMNDSYEFISSDNKDDKGTHEVFESVNSENKVGTIDWEDAIREVDEFLVESCDSALSSDDASKDKIIPAFEKKRKISYLFETDKS